MCGKGQSDGKNQKASPKKKDSQRQALNKPDGNISLPQQDIVNVEKVNQVIFFEILSKSLKQNNHQLNNLSNDKTQLNALQIQLENQFNFETFWQCLSQHLSPAEHKKLQVDLLIENLLTPYRRSYDFLNQKRHLVQSVNNLLEILEEVAHSGRQSENPKYKTSLEYLKKNFNRLALRFQQIIIIVVKAINVSLAQRNQKTINEGQLSSNLALQNRNQFQVLSQQKPQQSKEYQKEVESKKPVKVSKFTMKLSKPQQIDMIVSVANDKPRQNIQQKQEAARLEIIIIELRTQVGDLKQKLSEEQILKNRMQQEMDRLKVQNENYQNQVTNKEKQINVLRVQSERAIQDLKLKAQQTVNRLSAESQILVNSISQANKEKQQREITMNEQLQTLQRQYQAEKQANARLVQQSKEAEEKLKQENALLTKKLQQVQREKSRLESQLSELHMLLRRQRDSIEIIKHQSQLKLIEMDKQNSQIKMKLSELSKELKQANMFAGDILENQKDEKTFLIASIEKHINKTIGKTKILYDTQRNYNVNYHQRLDGKQNIVMIVQTKKALIAAYYSGKYAEGTYMSEEGLLLSLNNQKYYRLNNFANNPKKNRNDTKPVYGMIYDKFFLIFGNAQLRVKPGEKDRKVFSNFGINNSYFNSEGDNVSHFFGEGKTNEVEFIDYEIYQVVFEAKEQQVQKVQKIATQQKVSQRNNNEEIELVGKMEETQAHRFQLMAMNLEEESRIKDGQIVRLNGQIDQLKSTNNELQIYNQRLTLSIGQTQNQVQNLKSSVEKYQEQLRKKQAEVLEMKEKNENYMRSSAEAEQLYNRVVSQLQSVKLKNVQQSSLNTQLRSRLVSLESQIVEIKNSQMLERQRQSEQMFKQQNEYKSEEINRYNDSISEMNLSEQSIIKDKLQEALTNCESYKTQRQTQNKQILTLKTQLQEQKIQNLRRNQEMQQLNRLKLSLEEQKNQLLRTIQAKDEEIRRLSNDMNSLSEQLQKTKSLSQENRQLKQINMRLQASLEQQQQNRSKMRSYSFVEHISLFSGEILEKKKPEKRYLIDRIEQNMKGMIQKTKLLYQSIKDSKIPYHQRLDGKRNLVIIVQTQKAIIAGYYSGKYESNINMTEEGLILSLTNQKCYKLNNFTNNPKKNKNDKRPILGMVYDKFYFIIGNSEIRIKPGQNKPTVFSNFGVSSAYFNNEGDTVDVLLCEGKTNEVPLISYEVYEIIFAKSQIDQTL